MSKNWEKVVYFTTWMVLGSSFLVPRAYGVLHRMHHAYSDTDKDPHSPHFFKDIWRMMVHTAIIFRNFVKGKNIPDPEFTSAYLPQWDRLDKIGHHIITRLFFISCYITFYILFAPSYWYFFLLPIHFLMGPVQGAIVNWCGHKYGYSNYDNGDHSKNSSPWGVVLMGELFQNNHHYQKDNANFARRWFEFDLTFQLMRILNSMNVIQLLPVPVTNKQRNK